MFGLICWLPKSQAFGAIRARTISSMFRFKYITLENKTTFPLRVYRKDCERLNDSDEVTIARPGGKYSAAASMKRGAANLSEKLSGSRAITYLCPGASEKVQVLCSDVVTIIADRSGEEEGATVAEALELTFVKEVQIIADEDNGTLACVAGTESSCGNKAIYELASMLRN